MKKYHHCVKFTYPLSFQTRIPKIYLTKPGLFWGTVCVYLFEYESKNEIMKYTKYFFIYIYM